MLYWNYVEIKPVLQRYGWRTHVLTSLMGIFVRPAYVDRAVTGVAAQWSVNHTVFLSFFYRYYLFFRKRGRKGEIEGEKYWCARETSINCPSHASHWGPGPQHKHVPWLGIEPETLQFAGQHSIHWATPARASCTVFLLTWFHKHYMITVQGECLSVFQYILHLIILYLLDERFPSLLNSINF